MRYFPKNLNHKLIAVLLCFGFIPLAVQGIVSYFVIDRALQEKIDNLAIKSIERLTLNVADDLQSLLDMAYYYSRDTRVVEALETAPRSEEEQKQIQGALYNEIINSTSTYLTNYIFQYCVIDWKGFIYTNNTWIPNEFQPGKYFTQMTEKTWLQALKKDYINHLVLVPDTTPLSPSSGLQICAAANVINNGRSIGAVVFFMDEDIISKNLSNTKIGNHSNLFIIDHKGKSFIDGAKNEIAFADLPKDYSKNLNPWGQDTWQVKLNGEEQLLVEKKLYLRGIYNPMRIIALMQKNDFYKDLDKLQMITLSLAGFSLFALIGIAFMSELFLVRPILVLHKMMRRVEGGDLGVSIKVKGEDEVGRLGIGFNKMVEQLRTQISSIRETEEAKRRMEFRMLQFQIKPHFIRNSLNTIRWMAEIKGATGISKAIQTLMGMMEYNFKEETVITRVKDEISYVEEYLYLQKLRFQNRFTTSITVEEQILEYHVLKFTLQPIVENCVVHAFPSKKGLGNITINAKREEDRLLFTIEDNGVGMSEDSLQRLQISLDKPVEDIRNEHIALANVHKRIRINYGMKYGIWIDSVENQGTRVCVSLPLEDGRLKTI